MRCRIHLYEIKSAASGGAHSPQGTRYMAVRPGRDTARGLTAVLGRARRDGWWLCR
jgi:hypothetical protein